MASVIRSPSDGDLVGKPDMAIAGIVAPVAVVIEVVEADYIA